MYGKLICNLYVLLCWQNFILVKSGCYKLTWGAELDEGPDDSDTMPFPKENVIMMVYGGRPPSGGGAACLTQAPGPQLIAVGDMGTQWCNGMGFIPIAQKYTHTCTHTHTNIYIYIYIKNIYYS
jgi:hypothetical protein